MDKKNKKISLFILCFVVASFIVAPLQVVHAIESSSVFSTITDSDASIQSSQDQINDILQKPQLQIRIPGLNFTDPERAAQLTEITESERFFLVPYLAEYIRAIFIFSVAAAAIVATVVIVIGGFQWTASGGNKETIDQAKKRISGGVIGLGIILGSFTILNTINPALTEFKIFRVKIAEPIRIDDLPQHADLDEYLVSGNFKGSGVPWTIPETTITVELSKRDLCFFETFGADHEELKSRITKVSLFGCDIRVHEVIAPELQKRFDEVTNSNHPEVLAWKAHLEDGSLHKGKSLCSVIQTGGAFMSKGHSGRQKHIKKYGGPFGFEVTKNGIVNTALRGVINNQLIAAGQGSYVDKFGNTKTTKPPRHWVAEPHAWGVGFDLDWPHNNKTDTKNMPDIVGELIEGSSEMISWGNRWNDPAHFELGACPPAGVIIEKNPFDG